MASSEGAEILVKFVTQFDDIRVPASALSVPASLNKAGLSQVIGHILGDASTQQFEFCVATAQVKELEARRRAALASSEDGGDTAPIGRTLVRTTLRRYAKELGLSTEDVLVLEYAPALEPPSPGPSVDCTEWIAALASCSRLVVAGLYDGSVSFVPGAALSSSAASSFSSSALPLSAPMACHAGPVTGVALYDAEEGGAGGRASTQLATAGSDGVVMLWSVEAAAAAAAAGKGSKVRAPSSSSSSSYTLTQTANLQTTHGTPCGGVGIDPTGESVAAGDADGSVYVWALNEREGEQAGGEGGHSEASKGLKRKRGEASAREVVSRAALLTLNGAHAVGQQVSSLAWLGSGTLASGSWDHSVVVHDVEAGGVPLLTFRPGKVVTCLAASASGGSLASGHPDGLVRLWDPRGRGSSKAGGEDASTTSGGGVLGLRGTLSVPPAAAAGSSAVMGQPGSTWLSSLSWCPTDAHVLAGTAYSGAVCLWDVRAPGAPLHMSPTPHTGKALAATWYMGGEGQAAQILSGGEDKQVRCMSVRLPTAPAAVEKRRTGGVPSGGEGESDRA